MGSHHFLGALTRTQIMGGTKDLPRVEEIQRSYKLQPLSSFLGIKAPDQAPAIDWPVWTENDELGMKYWDYVHFLLNFITPHPDDKAMYEKLATLGIKAGADWNPANTLINGGA
jgi:hypothetical protein